MISNYLLIVLVAQTQSVPSRLIRQDNAKGILVTSTSVKEVSNMKVLTSLPGVVLTRQTSIASHAGQWALSSFRSVYVGRNKNWKIHKLPGDVLQLWWSKGKPYCVVNIAGADMSERFVLYELTDSIHKIATGPKLAAAGIRKLFRTSDGRCFEGNRKISLPGAIERDSRIAFADKQYIWITSGGQNKVLNVSTGKELVPPALFKQPNLSVNLSGTLFSPGTERSTLLLWKSDGKPMELGNADVKEPRYIASRYDDKTAYFASHGASGTRLDVVKMNNRVASVKVVQLQHVLDYSNWHVSEKVIHYLDVSGKLYKMAL